VALVISTARTHGLIPEDLPIAPATVHRLLSRHGLMVRPPDAPTIKDRRRFSFESRQFFRGVVRDARVARLLDESAAVVGRWHEQHPTGEREAFDRMNLLRSLSSPRRRPGNSVIWSQRRARVVGSLCTEELVDENRAPATERVRAANAQRPVPEEPISDAVQVRTSSTVFLRHHARAPWARASGLCPASPAET
jgi:hypothetical protein